VNILEGRDNNNTRTLAGKRGAIEAAWAALWLLKRRESRKDKGVAIILDATPWNYRPSTGGWAVGCFHNAAGVSWFLARRRRRSDNGKTPVRASPSGALRRHCLNGRRSSGWLRTRVLLQWTTLRAAGGARLLPARAVTLEPLPPVGTTAPCSQLSGHSGAS
jgi:hypothetical protein